MDHAAPIPTPCWRTSPPPKRGERAASSRSSSAPRPASARPTPCSNAARELRAQGVDVVVGLVETHGRARDRGAARGARGAAAPAARVQGARARRARPRRPARAPPAGRAGRRARAHQRPGQRVTSGATRTSRSCSTPASTSTPRSTSSTSRASTTWSRRSPACGCARPCPTRSSIACATSCSIDLPPRELIERLRQGKVYVPEQARAALQSFFSPRNLTALRELAMQTVAERVDADLRDYLEVHGPAQLERQSGSACCWRSTDTTTPSTWCAARAGSPSAARRRGRWCTSTPAAARARPTAPASGGLRARRRLGAETVTLRGSDVADELLRYAERNGVSSILIGQTRERPIARILNRTITQQLLDSWRQLRAHHRQHAGRRACARAGCASARRRGRDGPRSTASPPW